VILRPISRKNFLKKERARRDGFFLACSFAAKPDESGRGYAKTLPVNGKG
jgi:hypothetical protein